MFLKGDKTIIKCIVDLPLSSSYLATFKLHTCMHEWYYILYIHAAGNSSSDIISSDEEVIESDHAAATSITTTTATTITCISYQVILSKVLLKF